MFLNVLSILPLNVLYGLSSLLYFVMRYIWRYRRDVVARNLENAFPELSRAERRDLEKRFYRNFCDMFMETMKARRLGRDELLKRVRFTNMELLEREISNGQSMILLVAHQFNWEWMLLACSIRFPARLLAIYKPPHLRSFDRFLHATRGRFGAKLLSQRRTVAELRRRRDETIGIGILADQTESGGKGDYWTDFMHQPTAFSRNVQRLAVITQYPVYFGQIQRTRRGHYSVTWQQLTRPPYEQDGTTVLDSYVRAVERQVRQWPDNWLWTNRKWKQRPPKKHVRAT